MIDDVKVSDFLECLDSMFTLKTETGSWQAQLIKVSKNEREGRGGSSDLYENFSIEFLVSDQEHSLLPQAIYRFEHPKLGELPIFIVPVQQDEKGIYYQAVFTRLLKQDNRLQDPK